MQQKPTSKLTEIVQITNKAFFTVMVIIHWKKLIQRNGSN